MQDLLRAEKSDPMKIHVLKYIE